jgi:mannitol/fructose-specific phosphotransferase system IIA component (Ntr-type)
MSEKKEYLTYKGLPLVRFKNYIYFGEPSETHIIFLTILDTDSNDVPTKVSVELLLTDETKPPMERLLKKSEKKSLYEALDIGLIWLQRSLKK